MNGPGRWIHESPFAVTVCDADGIIVEMNARSREVFAKEGGGNLLGKSLLDCHPSPAKEKVALMLKDRKLNSYTIEKNGQRKLIYQSPWYEDGRFAGFVELSLPIPGEMPHHMRK
jgi:hypothetical protein